jgi:flagellar biosynthetic protein FliR
MNISLIQVFGILLAIGVRLTGILLFAPFFGSMVIPTRVKVVMVVALTAMLYPMTASKIPQMAMSQWPMLVISELIIGVALGVVTNLVFDGVQMAGQILSVQMGYSLVNILDPQTQVESTVVASFHQTIAMLIFLRLNVHFWILRALARSFDYLPPASGHIGPNFVSAAMHAGGDVFAVGIQIAAPVLSATLLADIALGLLGKA